MNRRQSDQQDKSVESRLSSLETWRKEHSFEFGLMVSKVTQIAAQSLQDRKERRELLELVRDIHHSVNNLKCMR